MTSRRIPNDFFTFLRCLLGMIFGSKIIPPHQKGNGFLMALSNVSSKLVLSIIFKISISEYSLRFKGAFQSSSSNQVILSRFEGSRVLF